MFSPVICVVLCPTVAEQRYASLMLCHLCDFVLRMQNGQWYPPLISCNLYGFISFLSKIMVFCVLFLSLFVFPVVVLYAAIYAECWYAPLILYDLCCFMSYIWRIVVSLSHLMFFVLFYALHVQISGTLCSLSPLSLVSIHSFCFLYIWLCLIDAEQ